MDLKNRALHQCETGHLPSEPSRHGGSAKRRTRRGMGQTGSTTDKGDVVFMTKVRDAEGRGKPAATGKFEGSEVYAYV